MQRWAGHWHIPVAPSETWNVSKICLFATKKDKLQMAMGEDSPGEGPSHKAGKEIISDNYQ